MKNMLAAKLITASHRLLMDQNRNLQISELIFREVRAIIAADGFLQ